MQSREVAARVVRVEVVLPVVVEIQVVEEHRIEPVRSMRAHKAGHGAGRLGAVLGDSAQLAQEKTEAGGRYERQGGELGMGAPTRGERQDDKLDRGKCGEVAIARGRGEVAGS